MTASTSTSQGTPSAELSRTKAMTVFAVFAFAYFFSTLVRAITATLAPSLVQEFSLNARDLGLLAGGYFLGFSVTQIPLGNWLDRFGPKRVVLSFLVVAVLGCVAFARAESFTGLLLARILTGVGVSACLMAPLTAYRRWYAPAHQLRANSWMLMVGALGMLASTLPVQWLLPLWGWRPLFLGLAVLVALAMVLMAWQLPQWSDMAGAAQPALTEADQSSPTGYAAVWANGYFRSLVPLGFFNYGGLVALQTLWVAPWLVQVNGFSPLQAATGLFWINLAMLGSFWLWGAISPWLARHGYTVERLIARGMPLSVGLIAIISVAGSAITTGATALFVLFFVASTVGSMAQAAVGMAFPPALAGRALSAYNLVIFCGVFAVQWGIGLLIDGFKAVGSTPTVAYQGALGVYALCCLGSYLYFLATKKP